MEVLVYLLAFSIVGTALFPLLRQYSKLYEGYVGDIEMREQARMVTDRISGEIRYGREFRIMNSGDKILFISEQVSGSQHLERGYYLAGNILYMYLDNGTLQPLTGSGPGKNSFILIKKEEGTPFVQRGEEGVFIFMARFVNTETTHEFPICVTVYPLEEEYGEET